jgi:hypothetical protein
VRQLWARRTIDAPAARLWQLITDPVRWPEWGPSVRRAAFDGGAVAPGARGTVTTVLNVHLPVEITSFDDGALWAWEVAGVPATSHVVVPDGGDRCRVGFGVPWWAAPYLAVGYLALRRLDGIASGTQVPA